jgi:hypothetical protein
MREPKDEKIGDATIRIRAVPGGWRGAVIRKGEPVNEHRDPDLQTLQTRLRNEAGKLQPGYVGMDGAIARFLHFFPGGFADPAFLHDERTYKLAAKAKLDAALPLDRAATASAEDAVALRPAFGTNLLSQFELMRVRDVLAGANGAAFAQAAARFTKGDIAAGLAGMTAAITPLGRSSWPMLTYLPSLWRPESHLFLKPSVTQDYARRIGHSFQFDYAADADASVYEALLDLASATRQSVAALGPRDGIDIQSFIWVVGGYKDADLARLERLRASA